MTLDRAESMVHPAMGVFEKRFLSKGGVLMCVVMTDYAVDHDVQ